MLEDNAGPARAFIGRVTYGARKSEFNAALTQGLTTYIANQLAAPDADDPIVQAMLAQTTLPIAYAATTTFPALSENRPLTALNATPAQLAQRITMADVPSAEIQRPAQEVRAATWIRAVHSPWQLKEMMVEFWHNHFNVDAFGLPQVSVFHPIYDKIMRTHWAGNFRDFLEAIATSVSMGYYLNNVSSRATAPNENYARELMELHTLGAGHYYDHQYPVWDLVPGALDGKPAGYIDDDVFGAARAFSGWTVSFGQTVAGKALPNPGTFAYVPSYHSTASARVLSVLLDSLTAPMAAGRKVLDLVATHPATATFVSTKIIRRLLADEPPPALVTRVAKTFRDAADAPDQLAQVIKMITLSPEFQNPAPLKFRRPYERVIAAMRTTGVTVQPSASLFSAMSATGYVQFNWSVPTGIPDTADYWLSSESILKTWNLLFSMFSGSPAPAVGSLVGQMPSTALASAGAAINYWLDRMLLVPVSPTTAAALNADAAQAGGLTAALRTGNATTIETAMRRLVALIAASDEFSYR